MNIDNQQLSFYKELWCQGDAGKIAKICNRTGQQVRNALRGDGTTEDVVLAIDKFYKAREERLQNVLNNRKNSKNGRSKKAASEC